MIFCCVNLVGLFFFKLKGKANFFVTVLHYCLKVDLDTYRITKKLLKTNNAMTPVGSKSSLDVNARLIVSKPESDKEHNIR